jgi:hypothetical protein
MTGSPVPAFLLFTSYRPQPPGIKTLCNAEVELSGWELVGRTLCAPHPRVAVGAQCSGTVHHHADGRVRASPQRCPSCYRGSQRRRPSDRPPGLGHLRRPSWLASQHRAALHVLSRDSSPGLAGQVAGEVAGHLSHAFLAQRWRLGLGQWQSRLYTIRRFPSSAKFSRCRYRPRHQQRTITPSML